MRIAHGTAVASSCAAWFWQDPASSAWVTGLFLVASITDWLDGYLARKMNASSAFGAFLDPVADKLMVAAVLVLLSTQPLAAGPLAGNAWVMPVATLIIIGLGGQHGPAAKAAVAVNSWGKWKTATQMAALTCLLFTRDGASSQLAVAAAAAGPPLLGIAAYLTAHSLAVYLAGLWKYMK
ncbi:hypothetical protein COO60DRAFT_1486656 [Scenedesmus sp. NREL 46B-D3]|nr:hypothetical protein COO60DRAFT_1486656 [Scenedesmus sp. NREL 46B-D3]